jgi:hypothetical protein
MEGVDFMLLGRAVGNCLKIILRNASVIACVIIGAIDTRWFSC